MLTHMTRRALVRRCLVAGSLAPIAALCIGPAAHGEAPELDPSEPTAKALGYVTKSAKPDSNCGNCSLFQGKAAAATGPCTIFPGKSVASAGWCISWLKKGPA